MKGAWNQFNRTVVIGLYDSYMRANALRRNLSSEALKGFRMEPKPNMVNVYIFVKFRGSVHDFFPPKK